MTHVLLIPSFYPTPSCPTHGMFFRDQGRALAEHGHRVGVLSVVELAPWQEREFWRAWRLGTAEYNDDGIATIQRPVRRWWPGRHWPRVRAWVRTGMRLFDQYVASFGAPDILHAHIADPAGMLALHIKQTHGLPFVLTEHATWLALGTKGATSDAVARSVFAEADGLVAVSPDLAQRLAARFDEPLERWECIPNVVDPAFLQLRLPQRVPAADEEFSFLYVANLIPRKGHQHLLRSFARAFRGDLSVSLRLVGGGPSLRALMRLAKALGIAEQTQFLHRLPRPAVLREVERCSVIVVPSEFETFGVMLIEGMAAGRPAVATRCGGPDWIVNDTTGLLVDVGDEEGLARAMSTLRREIGCYNPVAIRGDIERRFGFTAVAHALTDLYHRYTPARYSNSEGAR